MQYEGENFDQIEPVTRALKRQDPAITIVLTGHRHVIIYRSDGKPGQRSLMHDDLQAAVKHYRLTGDFKPGGFRLLPPTPKKNPRR